MVQLVQQIVAILLVLGLLVGTLTLLRKRGLAQFSPRLRLGASRPKEMRTIERISLGPQHSLHLINVRDDVFLIGVSPSGCSRIASFAALDEGAECREHE
jgi:flagellar biosynthetic protein FliO